MADDLTAIVATDAATVHVIGLDSMTERRPSIVVPPVAGASSEFFRSTIPLAHGTITGDERYVITNQGTVAAIAVADVVERKAWSLPLPGLERVAGVAVNRGWVNAGLLAAHGGGAIAVYAFTPTTDPVLLAKLPVRNPRCWTGWSTRGEEGPFCSIAWSTDGRYLIVATDDGPAEFMVVDVRDGGVTLVPLHLLTACRDPMNFANGIFTLNGLINPTATPTSAVTTTAEPTITPSSTATPTTPTVAASATQLPSATGTASPTATATRLPKPVYLPLVLAESCTPNQRHVDAVLVLDASSSMLGPTTTGRSKLAAAQDAARAFLDAIHLDAGDQAALVAFNADAWLVAPLTTDRTALDAGLASLTTARFTRIDRGITVARDELANSRRHRDNVPVMIVLTDGRNNPVPVDAAVEEARLAKTVGVQLFTIGLGADLDAAALAQMASRPEWFYVAPDAEQLADIYRAIAVTIPCPAAGFWGGR